MMWAPESFSAKPQIAQIFDFTLLGNAVVDAMADVDEALLQKFNLRKNDSNTLNLPQMMALTAEVQVKEFRAGGSAANTAYTLARLGAKVAFVGLIGDDPTGRYFHDALVQAGVTVTPPHPGRRTTDVFVLITPDGARTMVQGTPAAPSTDDSWLNENLVAQAKTVLLGAYAAGNWPAAVHLAAQTAKIHHADLVLSLASPRAVQAAATTLVDLMTSHHPLVLGNAAEWGWLLAMSDAHTARLLEHCPRVITNSGEGAVFVSAEGHEVAVPTEKIEAPRDMSGAGDAFAAGFLWAQLHGKDMVTALTCGHALGGATIRELGARLKDPLAVLKQAGLA